METEEKWLRRKQYMKEWHRANQDKVIASRKRRFDSGKQSAYHKQWRDRNRAHLRAYGAKYRNSHREELRIAGRLKISKFSPEKKKSNLLYQKQWIAKNHSRVLERSKRYRAYQSEWRKKNRGRCIASSHHYRALKKASAINLSSIKHWMHEIKSKSESTCYYCQSVIPSSEVHFDHIVALSKGGPHSIENLCVSCPSCNHRKNNKSVNAWVKIGQQILSL